MHWNSNNNHSGDPAGDTRSQADQGTVQVLSPSERENFDGMTIDQESSAQNKAGNSSPFKKVFRYQSFSQGPVSKLIVSALLLMAVMVFLPLAIILFATIGLNWLSNRDRRE